MVYSPDPLFNIHGKVALVAGAAGGIGSAIVAALSARGCKLLLLDKNTTALEAMSVSGEENIVKVSGDITNEADCIEAVEAAVQQFGAIDIIVNAAGVLPMGPADSMDVDVFRQCLDSNVTGALLLSRAAARCMPNGGTIVHIASVSSFVANINYAAYAASKSALSQLIKVLAREWASRNIRVNAIGPALIETQLTKGYLSDSSFRKNAIASIPMGRISEAEDLLGILILLCSSAGAFITGQTIYADGGRTLV